MPLFRYEAVAAGGEVLRGEMEEASQASVVDRLQRQGHVPLRADLVRGRGWSAPRLARSAKRSANLALLTRQLATLLQAGLPLDRALEIAQGTLDRPAERERLGAVLDRLRGGSTLADAMAAQEGYFPKFYVGMVRAGEAGASLDTTLAHLGDYLERARAAAAKVKSALAYPAMVLGTGLLSVGILFAFVIPRFEPLFAEAQSKLPAAAEAVLWVSHVLDDWGAAILVGLLALALVLWRAFRLPAMRRRWDALVLRLPILGEIATKLEIARFGRTLGTLLRNGVPSLTALAMTRDALHNGVIAAAVAGASSELKEGKGLADPLARTGAVPSLALQLIRVGEETARLDEMLLKLAEIYEEETQRSVERLLALLVPGTTILLGLLVALVMGSLLTAVLSAYELAM